MTTKNCANVPKLVLKDLCEKSFVRNVLYSSESDSLFACAKAHEAYIFLKTYIYIY